MDNKDKTIVDEIRKMGYEACLWGTKEARKVQLRAGYQLSRMV